MSYTTWIARARPRPAARLRLFCFPYAAGGESIFRAWGQALPEDIEVCAVRLPGRDARYREPLFARVTPLVRAIADGLADDLAQPYALFGHSMGARIAFELAREQRRRGRREPALLVASGRAAPHCPPRDLMNALPTDQLLDRLRQLDGTPEAVLREPELMAMFLPIVRADLAVSELEDHRPEPPLACPLVAFGGTADQRCTTDELGAWRDHTAASFTLEQFPGGHFFLNTASAAVLASLARALAAVPTGPASGE